MSKQAFTLKKRKETEEMHLFQGDFSTQPCTSTGISICKKMQKSESAGNVFTCKTEEEARTACAAQGRAVCGTCVSSLYATY